MKKRGHRFIDLTGKKFGKLTAISFVGVDHRGTSWQLRCDCGETVVRLASNFKKNHHHTCGCEPTNPGKPDAGFRRLFSDYKASAMRRGYKFKLSKALFRKMINENCHYCNTSPSKRYEKQVVHTLLANGIDRIDNKIGYLPDNVVTCCSRCNVAKNKMDQKEFVNWVFRVCNNLRELKDDRG